MKLNFTVTPNTGQIDWNPAAFFGESPEGPKWYLPLSSDGIHCRVQELDLRNGNISSTSAVYGLNGCISLSARAGSLHPVELAPRQLNPPPLRFPRIATLGSRQPVVVRAHPSTATGDSACRKKVFDGKGYSRCGTAGAAPGPANDEELTGGVGGATPAVWEPSPSFCNVLASSFPVGFNPCDSWNRLVASTVAASHFPFGLPVNELSLASAV